MNLNEHTTPSKLERYAFIWSEVRLILAAVALFLGGYPLALKVLPIPLTSSLLVLAWIISGVAAIYLGYRWNKNDLKLFGHNDKRDRVAFFVTIISGINLGLVGLIGQNIGMSISNNKFVFMATGLLYLASAYHLYNRWKAHGEKIFY